MIKWNIMNEKIAHTFNHIPSKTAGRYPTSNEAAALKFLLIRVDCQSKIELIGKAIIVLVGHPRNVFTELSLSVLGPRRFQISDAGAVNKLLH